MAAMERIEPGVATAMTTSRTSSFEAFFEERHGDLFAALWLITRNRHEAEEVMQDAFLRVWERWERVAEMDRPDGYLYRVAMNLVRSRARRARIAIRRATNLIPPDDAVAGSGERPLSARSPTSRRGSVLPSS